MHTIYAIGHSIISPLGNSSGQNLDAVLQRKPAIKKHRDTTITDDEFYAARLEPNQLQMIAARYGNTKEAFSPFEQMCIYAIEAALAHTEIDISREDCILIFSSTKGNIEWLGRQSANRIGLYYSASLVSAYFSVKHKPLIVSNACISGSLALIMGKRLLETGKI